MYSPRLPRIGTWPAFRTIARRLESAGIVPSEIDWALEGEPVGLFSDIVPTTDIAQITVSRSLSSLLQDLTAVRTRVGLGLAYKLFWRSRHDRLALTDRSDPDVARARDLAKSVHRDVHKMQAFLRFRELRGAGERRCFVAWFEPDHRIEERAATFFARRFGDMDWIIRTPETKITFFANTLRIEVSRNKREVAPDDLENLWLSYYANIFNPARLKVSAMTSEMPRKYWRNLPEAQMIPSLVSDASRRVAKMLEVGGDVVPEAKSPQSLDKLAPALLSCHRCSLCRQARRPVPGRGPSKSAVVIVGEQPGEMEDQQGVPFVGPSGQLLDRVLKAVGLKRDEVWLTNAVKHFKFIRKGTRRIHATPSVSEIDACRWWLDLEHSFLRPRICVALGASAAHALTGTGAGLLQRRGKIELGRNGTPVLISLHPAHVLRQPTRDRRREARRMLFGDFSEIERFIPQKQ